MQHLPDMCLRLVDHLIRAVENPAVPLTFSEIVPQLREIRDFTLTDAQLPIVLAIVQRLASASLASNDLRERDSLLTSLADTRAIGRLIHSVPDDLRSAPPELVALLQMLPGDHLRSLSDVLEEEHGDGARRVVRTFIERYVLRDGEQVIERMLAASSPVACDLLRSLRYVSIQRAVDAVRLASGRNDLDFELAALRVLEAAPVSHGTTLLLGAYVGSSHDEVRLWALALITQKRLAAAFPVILERARTVAVRGLPASEAAAYGEALAATDPGRALDTFREWIRPKGLFSALASPILQFIAVSGLTVLPGDEPEALIRVASDKGGVDLQRHCTACMIKRRRAARSAPR